MASVSSPSHLWFMQLSIANLQLGGEVWYFRSPLKPRHYGRQEVRFRLHRGSAWV